MATRGLLVVGLHEASIVARHAAYVFELLGIPTAVVVDGSEANLARLVRLGGDDSLLAVGFRRAHPQTVAYVKAAASQGAHTIVITDNSLSELAGKGDITLSQTSIPLFRPLAGGSSVRERARRRCICATERGSMLVSAPCVNRLTNLVG